MVSIYINSSVLVSPAYCRRHRTCIRQICCAYLFLKRRKAGFQFFHENSFKYVNLGGVECERCLCRESKFSNIQLSTTCSSAPSIYTDILFYRFEMRQRVFNFGQAIFSQIGADLVPQLLYSTTKQTITLSIHI